MSHSEDIKKTILKNWWPIYHQGARHKGCLLCKKYNALGSLNICYGCPIYIDTKKIGCLGTPFDTWDNNPTQNNAREELLYLLRLFRKHRKIERGK